MQRVLQNILSQPSSAFDSSELQSKAEGTIARQCNGKKGNLPGLKPTNNLKKQIFIFPAFPKTMVLNHNIDSSGNMDVTCMVENVYPEPTIHLLWNERCVPFILSGWVKKF